MPTSTPTIKYFLASAALGGDAPSMTITTNATDREGDRVVPEGGKFANFLKNPVVCFVHDYKQLPIGRVTKLEVEPGKGINATWDWLKNDVFADRVKNAYEQGCINASSIGFIPLESTPNGKGLDITEWEMLELTLCPIPMNPEAVRAMKSLGFLGEAKADAAVTALRAAVATLKTAVVAKGFEFSCGLNAVGCVESLLSMEQDEPEQAAVIRQAGQHLLTYLQQEYEECYGKDDDGGDAMGAAATDEPLIPMDDDSKYPFVSATGLTGDAKLALVKGINDTFSALVKRGRVLSAANEAKLQNAHGYTRAAHDCIKEVLDAAMIPLAGGGKRDPNLLPDSADDASGDGGADGAAFLTLAVDDAFTLELSDDAPRLTIALEQKDGEDLLDVDPAALTAALRDVVTETLRAEVSTAMQTAIDRARGRVVV